MRERSIIIEATAEEIWEMMPADRIAEWIPYMASSKSGEYVTEVNTQEDKYQPGTTMLFFDDCHYEVLESLVKRKIIYHIYEKAVLGRLGGRLIFSIEPIYETCKFTYRAEFDEFPNIFIEKLVGNYFTMRWFEKQLKTNTENLKAILEK